MSGWSLIFNLIIGTITYLRDRGSVWVLSGRNVMFNILILLSKFKSLERQSIDTYDDVVHILLLHRFVPKIDYVSYLAPVWYSGSTQTSVRVRSMRREALRPWSCSNSESHCLPANKYNWFNLARYIYKIYINILLRRRVVYTTAVQIRTQ